MLPRHSLLRSLLAFGLVPFASWLGAGCGSAPRASAGTLAEALGEAGLDAGVAGSVGYDDGGVDASASGGQGGPSGGGSGGGGSGGGGSGGVVGTAGRASSGGKGGKPGFGGSGPSAGGTGAGASGGSAGTPYGGAAGGDVVDVPPRPDDCPPEPTWTAGLIDDFQDGDLILPSAEGLVGSWQIVGDPGGTPDPVPAIDVEPDPDDPTNLVLHAVAGAYVDPQWGASTQSFFSAGARPPCIVDVSGFDAIAFRMKLAGSCKVELATAATEAVVAGGTCDGTQGTCYDHFGFDISGDGEWQDFELPFATATQDGWGAHVACFGTQTLMGMAFNFSAAQTPFEYWVDDIHLVSHPKSVCSPVVPPSGLLHDFQNSTLALPAPLTGAWNISSPFDFEDDAAAGHAVLHLQTGAAIDVGFSSGDANCGIDASQASGLEVRLRTPAAGDLNAYWVGLTAPSSETCSRCPNSTSCIYTAAQPINGDAAVVPGAWRTYRLPFPDSSAPLEDLTSLTLVTTSEAYVDYVRLYASDPRDLGGRCTQGSDCTTAFCQSGDGAPAGGSCTVACNYDGQCQAWKSGAACVGGYCVETCQTNDSDDVALRADKCHGRVELACDDSRFCTPRCTSDAQCDAGLYCDGSGVCLSSLSSGSPNGASCAAGSVTCNASCLSLTQTCTELCTLGCDGSNCNTCASAGGQCLPLLGFHASGDAGACATACNCNMDCPAGLVCEPVTLSVPLDGRGLCASPDSVGAGIVTCPTACSSGPSRACRGDANCLGVAQCLDAERGYGPCVCSDTPDSSAGGAPADGQAGAPGSGGEPSITPEGGRPSAGDAGGASPGQNGDEAGASPIDAGGRGMTNPGAGGGTAGKEPAAGEAGQAEATENPPVRTLDSSCGCRVGASDGERSSGGLVLAFAALVGIRRRRQRSRQFGSPGAEIALT